VSSTNSADGVLRRRLLHLAREKPSLRRYLIPLLRKTAEEKGREAGRVWDSGEARQEGQTYGPPYTTVQFKETPPTNEGRGKCWSDKKPSERKERDRCYVKRDLGKNLSKRDYNREYREQVLK
jgi:hypothetical protein